MAVGRALCDPRLARFVLWDSTAAGVRSGVMEGRRRGGIAGVASGFHRNHYGTFQRLVRKVLAYLKGIGKVLALTSPLFEDRMPTQRGGYSAHDGSVTVP